ncbi:hypothetical protein [Microcoleus sp. CAWBG58]|uniref:hypothetical protein n=1 Tax=Microcoleus sp. CAWBG58 TaxID=2841651 RepID=UPI0025FBB19E|nr:hypothetical protein [Microcoleus sp. CAWBG58]
MNFCKKEQEESCTSKSSFWDGDELPVCNANKPATYQFSGRRLQHEWYQNKEGHLINANAQGAANIGRKIGLTVDS